ncbi:hypothetical protein W97_06320 [Coniosporium apollinis CBS 100218]|uniref:Uncharacterized protein n=1 Tax=Coniosporium apollinis (strain CBS 100218) TaxID=1168221 RepID=R7YYD1_CONA1|nr:uncharacterized protein W97_06320 [Coniosporium apollinis CBS 100218]EON66917.1 hypothetical protein W97_06320 [Coniosporium apollinis CBS 100218]
MLFLGGGITAEEMNELKERAGEDAGKVQWVKARMEMVMELGGLSIDNVETVTKRMLKEAVVQA